MAILGFLLKQALCVFYSHILPVINLSKKKKKAHKWKACPFASFDKFYHLAMQEKWKKLYCYSTSTFYISIILSSRDKKKKFRPSTLESSKTGVKSWSQMHPWKLSWWILGSDLRGSGIWPKPTHRLQSPRGAYYALRAFYCRLELDLPLQLLHCPRKSKPLSRSSKSRSRSREKEGERARTRSTSFPFRSCKYRSLIKKNPSISLGSIIIVFFFFFLSF